MLDHIIENVMSLEWLILVFIGGLIYQVIIGLLNLFGLGKTKNVLLRFHTNRIAKRRSRRQKLVVRMMRDKNTIQYYIMTATLYGHMSLLFMIVSIGSSIIGLEIKLGSGNVVSITIMVVLAWAALIGSISFLFRTLEVNQDVGKALLSPSSATSITSEPSEDEGTYAP